MAVRGIRCHYEILRGLIRDCKYGQVQPFLVSLVKKHGLVGGRVGKILVHYLLMKNNVSSALKLICNLKENNLWVTFPVDVLSVLTQRGRVLDAYKLLVSAENNLPFVDVVDYSIVIDGLCRKGHIDRALSLCGLANKKGIKLNVVVYNIILNGLCRQSCLIEAFRLFDSLERNDVVPSDITYGTMIDALVREGFLLDARQLFERMVLKGLQPNTHIYNSLIGGYCKFGNLKEALKLLDDLEINSLKPEEFTISAVIDGFCRQGHLQEALYFFEDAKEKGIFPDFFGFLYLARGLCAKGRMQEARDTLIVMLQTDSVVELINEVINNVEPEIETDSTVSLLIHLCEQRSIEKVVVFLNGIGATLSAYRRNAAYCGKGKTLYSQEIPSTDSLEPLSFIHDPNLDVKTEQEAGSCYTSGHVSQLHDFDAFYLQLESLCSAGNIQEASKLAIDVASGLAKN
ncbi:hypothetical protein Ancab_017709 [Ancistrocladus abbreviatus]